MKLSSKIIIAGVVVVAALAVTYRAVNQAPDANLPADKQMAQIMEDGGCIFCHTANPDLPFYADYPIAKTLIKKDVEDGYKAFDIAPMIQAMEEGKAVNEVDLNKVEKAVMDGTMPLMQYYLAHWGSSLTSTKTDMVLAWVKQHREKFYPNPLAADEFKNEPVRPIPDAVPTDSKKVALGELLYHDTRLSGDGTISCATCHGVGTAGVDNKQYSEGIRGQKGGVNAPTSFNACFHFAQFWDGRAATLAAQAGGPPLNPVEMGSASFEEICARLAQDQAFVAKFKAVYPEGLSEATITDAIAEYEKTLITPNSPFDRYLKGEKDAMTAEQVEGYALFKDYNCATCHAGVAMGGQSYELMGARADYFKDRNQLQVRTHRCRQRTMGTDEGGTRPLSLQNSDAPQRRTHLALLSRWLRQNALRGCRHDEPLPGWSRNAGSGQSQSNEVPRSPHRRTQRKARHQHKQTVRSH